MKNTVFFLMIFMLGCGGNPVIQTNQTINVTGFSQIKIKPDISIINLNATAVSASKSGVVTQINGMVDSVLTGIKTEKIRINERSVNNLDIYWTYVYGKDRKRSIEYNARQTIELKMNFDIDEIEKLMSVVREIPGVDFSLRFDISGPRKDSAENVLAKMSIEDAKRKSANVASAAHLEVVKILDITYQSDHPGAFMKSEVAFARGAADRINLEPREIELNDNIKVTYQVRNKK